MRDQWGIVEGLGLAKLNTCQKSTAVKNIYGGKD